MANSITRWAPLTDFSELRSRLDRVFDEIAGGEERAWTPRVDVVREESGLVIRADVPGIKPEEIDISISEGILTLSGEHEESSEEKKKDYLRRERRFGSFSRSLSLPDGVDPEQIEAECKNGVLEVAIPVPKRAESKKVQIKPKPRG